MTEQTTQRKDDDPGLDRFIEEQERTTEHQTAEAEREALRRGKEPFDLDRLERL